jgi:hypothetical protein
MEINYMGDLFHPQNPNFQKHQIHPVRVSSNPAAKLITDLGSAPILLLN